MFDDEPPRAPEEGVRVRELPDSLAPGLSDLELVSDIWAADAREARHAAEKDGTIVGLVQNGTPLEPLFGTKEADGTEGSAG